jgi:hypothetical protein
MAGQVHGQAHGCSRRVQGEKKASCVKMLASRQARHNLFFFLSLSLSLSLSFVAAAQDPELEQ